MSFRKSRGSAAEKSLSPEEQQAKINEVRKMIGPIADKLPVLCSDASISRYLRARNWNTKKAAKMLKETLKWRLEYKPEKIRWEDVAQEAESGKIYRADYLDKHGRTVLVMRPGFQNTSSTVGQIRYLVYSMENAIMNLNPDQEQMVWLIDFQGWNRSSISIKVTRETAHVLQNHYPERLGIGILYNPPKLFESFWTMVKPFFEPKTYKKVRFVYSDDPQSQKIMEELFDMDKVESAFGGRNTVGFDYKAYAQMMMEDENRRADLINSGCSSPTYQLSIAPESLQSESLASELGSEASDAGSGDEMASSKLEGIDEKAQDPLLGCTDVAYGEEAAAAKEVKSGDEMASSKLDGVDEKVQDPLLGCTDVAYGEEAAAAKEVKSGDEMASSKLDGVDEKVQDPLLGCTDVTNGEAAAAAAKEVQSGDEMASSKLDGVDEKAHDLLPGCTDVANGEAAAAAKEAE